MIFAVYTNQEGGKMIEYSAQVNDKKSQRIIGKVYTGRATVRTKDGRYLYSKYSGITRLTAKDAIQDAIQIFK